MVLTSTCHAAAIGFCYCGPEVEKAMALKPLFLVFLLIPCIADAAAPRCFSVSEMNGWRSPDGKTIYIRTGANSYYRLDLARECSTLKSINPHLVLRSRASNLVCTALDLDVKASASPAGIVEPCFPKTLTELSAVEVAALPRDAKP
jgi:hypothetical protein